MVFFAFWEVYSVEPSGVVAFWYVVADSVDGLQRLAWRPTSFIKGLLDRWRQRLSLRRIL